MNKITQTMRYRQAVIEYSMKYGVTKAAIRYRTNRQYILNDFFYKLGDPAQASMTVRIPNNFLFTGYQGFSLNFFGAATPYINFLRVFLTASFAIFTVIICYNKLRTFFTEEG